MDRCSSLEKPINSLELSLELDVLSLGRRQALDHGRFLEFSKIWCGQLMGACWESGRRRFGRTVGDLAGRPWGKFLEDWDSDRWAEIWTDRWTEIWGLLSGDLD